MAAHLSLILVVLCGCIVPCTAATEEVLWDGLSATFLVFDPLPRTVSDAVDANWTLDDSTGSCSNGSSYFKGNRYILNDDTSSMLLYDVNGYIAGKQTGIPKSGGGGYPSSSAHADMFYEESDMWVITVYFVDPTTICSPGRTSQEFTASGTGTQLWFQTGQTPSELLEISRDADAVVNDTNFESGLCFSGMGEHYWYSITADMSCDDFFPFFLLFRKGTLVAYGVTFVPYYENTAKWEHPPTALFGAFMPTVPTCLAGQNVTTQHTYLTMDPSLNTCPTAPPPRETTTSGSTSHQTQPLVALVSLILVTVFARSSI